MQKNIQKNIVVASFFTAIAFFRLHFNTCVCTEEYFVLTTCICIRRRREKQKQNTLDLVKLYRREDNRNFKEAAMMIGGDVVIRNFHYN